MTQALVANPDTTLVDAVPPDAPPPCRPWGEIGRAVLYHLIAIALGTGGAVVYLIALAILHRRWGWIGLPPNAVLMLLISVLMQLALIRMAVARARRLNSGDAMLGLAAGPIPASGLFKWVAIAEIGLIILGVAGLRASPAFYHGLLASADRNLLLALWTSPLWVLGIVANLAVLAPIYEELLFRGWLWTALRRSWGVRATALTTTALWLVLHVPEGLAKLLTLLPLAAILCLVRHRTGSVRATIAVHLLNNARAVLLPIACLWYS